MRTMITKKRRKDWSSFFSSEDLSLSPDFSSINEWRELEQKSSDSSSNSLDSFFDDSYIGELSDLDFKKRQKMADMEEKELLELGLEPVYHLIGPFYIYKSAAQRIQSSFESVVLPSLFTKAFGRFMIISGLIPSAAKGIGHFLLANLMYGAWPIALIAATVRFTYVLVMDLRAGESWSKALKHAGIEAVKTAVKFFLIYMIWTLAIALCTSGGLLTGGLLPVGILVVGVIVTLGFMLATFLVDKLPGILIDLKGSWTYLKEKLYELKSGILPALLEGSSWTLMDNSLISISGHIAGFFGKVLDLVGVSLIVSGLFFLGAVLHNTIAHHRAINKRKRKIDCPEKRDQLRQTIRNATKEGHGPQRTLTRMKELQGNNPDPRLQAATVKYQQAMVILAALNRIEENPTPSNFKGKDLITTEEFTWFTISIASLAASSGSLMPASNLPDPKDDLATLSKISFDLSGNKRSNKKRGQQTAKCLREQAEKSRDTAFKVLNMHGVFAPEKDNSVFYSSSGEQFCIDVKI